MRAVRATGGRPQARWGGLAQATPPPSGQVVRWAQPPRSRFDARVGARRWAGPYRPLARPRPPSPPLSRRLSSPVWRVVAVALLVVGGVWSATWAADQIGDNARSVRQAASVQLAAAWRAGQQLAVGLFHQATAPGVAAPAMATTTADDPGPVALPSAPAWGHWWMPASRAAGVPTPQAALSAAIPGFGVYLEQTGGGTYGSANSDHGLVADKLQLVRRDSAAGAGGEWPPPGAEALLPIDPSDLEYERESPRLLPAPVTPTPTSPSTAIPAPATPPVPPAPRADNRGEAVPEPSHPSVTVPARPVVWIYHTHSAESYHTAGRQSVAEHYDWNSTRSGVMQVGDEMVRVLSQEGVTAYHDRTINDFPSFGQAYENSRRRLKEVLRKYPSIRLIIDIHRDGTNYAERSVTVAGQTAARVGLVVAGNEYLSNPRWRENLFFAQKLDAQLREEYPGLSRGIIPRMDARFNQDLLQPALLLEIGTYTNRLEEARRTARFVAQALAKVLP